MKAKLRRVIWVWIVAYHLMNIQVSNRSSNFSGIKDLPVLKKSSYLKGIEGVQYMTHLPLIFT